MRYSIRGKVIVFGGDFRQILLVIRHGTEADVVSACLNRSPLWSHVKVLKLTINMRLRNLSSNDTSQVSDCSKFLLRVGEGTEPDDENQMIHVDHNFVVAGESVSDLVAATYGDIKVNYNNPDYIYRRSLMCPKNDTTDSINQYVMNLIPGEASTLLSADSVGKEQAAMYPTEFLNSITPNGLPLIDCTLLRSLDPTQGMCNGTRLTVKAFLNRIIDTEIATGVHKGKRVFIARIPMTPSDTDFPFVLRRRQFPMIRLFG